MDISSYSGIINQLKTLVFEPDFDDMLLRLTRNESNSARFLIKMELKRLASPCQRVIDLRKKTSEPCQEYEHDGRIHYLDEATIRVFESALKEFRGRYTMGVYENVMAIIANRKLQPQPESAAPATPRVKRKPVPGGIEYHSGRVLQLCHYAGRAEERMHFSIPIDVELPSGKVFKGQTSNLSISGIKIRLPEQSALSSGLDVTVKFIGLKQDFILDDLDAGVEYKVLGRDKVQDGSSWYRLLRQDDSKIVDNFINKLVQTNKHRYKVDLNHVIEAVTSKAYEQFYVTHMQSLPLFISQNDGRMSLNHTLASSGNAHLLTYWRDEKYRLQIEAIFNAKRLRHLLSDGHKPLILYTFTHTASGKLFFYSASADELQERGLFETFTTFGATKPSFRIFQLQGQPIEPEKARVTTLKNVGTQPELQYNELPPRLAAQVEALRHMILMKDITTELQTQAFAQQRLDRSKLGELKIYLQKKVLKSRLTLEALKQDDLRREPRFAYQTPLSCKLGDTRLRGQTRDISTFGIQIELEQPLVCENGETLQLEFTELNQKTKKYRLAGMPYEVVGQNATGTVLHLKIDDVPGRHEGYKFIKMLIANNRDKLSISGGTGGIRELTIALRNLTVYQRTTTPFYVHKRGARYALDSIARSEWPTPITDLLDELGDEEKGTNLFPLVQADHTYERVLQPLKQMVNRSQLTAYEIYLRISRDRHGNLKSMLFRFADEFETDRERQLFIGESLQNAEFKAWRISFVRSGRPDTELIGEELAYISRYAIHRAKEIENDLWSVVGVGETEDVTEATRAAIQG